MQWASRALNPWCMAGATADLVEDIRTTHTLFGGRLQLGCGKEHGKADKGK